MSDSARAAQAVDAMARRGTQIRNADILVLSPTPTAPTDQGNRKRIYAVCRELQRRGARIHFLHYPHEWWFSHAPMDLAREMSAQWDSFHLVPATRPLHGRAHGEDHTIDEWWDHSIGDYLKWLFSKSHFDAFIVNYTYLSKAFEFAPQETLRILDTHDKFTDRRKLLESNGVAAEFFYTTAAQEAIALDRAHLVWAIKDEEAEFFRSISKTPCITMPHVEPRTTTVRQRKPEDEGYLVLGMLGANNAINRVNARHFVDQAIPLFRQQLAPVKIRFAGGMCGGIQDLAEIPGVELMGRVDTVEEFYQAIDVVTVPLAFSTGLKIKAVEAFSAGVPVVAMGHALEGIPVKHPYHRCHTVQELAGACMALAYDSQKLERLRAATVDTYAKVERQAEEAFDYSARQINRRARMIVTLDRAFFELDSSYREHAIQTLHYLRHLGRLTLYFDQPIPASQANLFEAFNGLTTFGNVCLAPGATHDTARSIGMPSFTSSLEDLLAERANATLWMLRMPGGMETLPDRLLRQLSLFVRTDTLRTIQPAALALLPALLERCHGARVVDCAGGAGVAQALAVLPDGAEIMQVPFWRWKPWQIRGETRKRIDLLTHVSQLEYAQALATLLDSLHPDLEPCRLVADEDISSVAPAGALGGGREIVSTDRLLSTFGMLGALPQFVVDITNCPVNAGPYRETLVRCGIDVLAARDLRGGPGFPPATSLSQFVDYVVDYDRAAGKDAVQALERATYGRDAGWTLVWKTITKKNVFA